MEGVGGGHGNRIRDREGEMEMKFNNILFVRCAGEFLYANYLLFAKFFVKTNHLITVGIRIRKRNNKSQ